MNAELLTVWKSRLLGTLSGVLIIAVLVCTLWPFNPLPPNRVQWLSGTGGIGFFGAGVVASKTLLRTPRADTGKYCSLELLLRPAGIEGVHTILSFYAPNNPKQFLVRQWTDGLLVSHDVVDGQKGFRTTKFDVDHPFQPGKLVLLTISSGPNGTTVYINGVQPQLFSRFMVSQRDLEGQIVIGTSPVDYQPWQGEVRGLSIYSQEITPVQALEHYNDWTKGRGNNSPDLDRAIARYAFTEGSGREIRSAVSTGPVLEIPRRFRVPHKALLASPAKEFEANWRYVSDLLVNIAGFVPLGFVACAFWACRRSRRQAILYTILLGGGLSFVIEVLQAYIPQRVSGTTDVITNTLGAALGAVIAGPTMLWTTKVLSHFKRSVNHMG